MTRRRWWAHPPSYGQWMVAVGVALLLVVAGWYFHSQYEQQTRLVAQQYSAALEVAYRSTVNMYRLDVATRVDAQIVRPEVTTIMRRAADADEMERRRLRGDLFRIMRPIFVEMRRRGARQLYFHEPDGVVFLRMHRPERVGDSQMEFRHSIRVANTELQPVTGFEGGSHYPSFRHVFPLLEGGEHLGSVDLSLSFEQIHEVLTDLVPASEFAFLLRPEVSRDLVFTEMRPQFIESPLHGGFFQEHPTISRITREFQSSPTATALAVALRERGRVHSRMSHGESFAVPLRHAGRGYVVSFHAIQDTADRHAAYVVGFNDAPVIARLHDRFLIQFLLVAVSLVLTAMATWWLLRHRLMLVGERARLEAITQSMGEGLYVLDRDGCVSYVNQAATQSLGYAGRELEGRAIHDLIHCHHGEREQPLAQCPELMWTIGRGMTYEGEETFIDRDGTAFPVRVHCEPLLEAGQIIGAVTAFRDITERKRREAELQRLATTDPLTGLYNRRRFYADLERELARCQRAEEGGAALLMVDIDHFKHFNDAHGHAAGDAVLCHLADLFRHALRRIDAAGRLGGEEFAVLLPETDRDGAERLAKRLCALCRERPAEREGRRLPFTISVGVTVLRAADSSPDAPMARADAALYKAKAGGRDRVAV